MTELLPCPFCGGEAELHPTYDMDTNEVDGWFVWCNSDACECKPETGQFFTEAEAIAAWNTRADDYRQAAEYWQRMYEETFAERTCKPVENDGVMRCSNCDYPLGIMSIPAYCAGCGSRVVGE